MPPAASARTPRAKKAAPEIIGSRDACRILDINKSTLTRWVASGRITPAGRIGKGVTSAFVFYRADVEKIAAAK